MAVTIEQLRLEVNTQDNASENTLLTRCLAVATGLLNTYLDDNLTADEILEIPETTHDQALLTAAADLFHQAKAPNGVAVQEYDTGNGEVAATPIRISRDPLRGARAVLEMHVGPAIA